MRPLLLSIVFIKVLLLALFSSEYKEAFFLPFIEIFLKTLSNPWTYVLDNSLNIEFPYHSLMLYIYSIFYLPAYLMNIDNYYLSNLFFKIPTLVSDLLILYFLNKLLPNRRKEIIILYFCSPIILYACYIHSQLDLFPIMLLFGSIYFIKKHELTYSSLLIGLACATKLNVLVVLPLIFIYILKNYKIQETLTYLFIFVFIYFIMNIPFIYSDGFQSLVLFNQPQSLFFSLSLAFGEGLNIFITLFLLSIIYVRFAYYQKINSDLLDSYLALAFALLIFTISPRPGWYVWIVPFVSVIAIKYSSISFTRKSAYTLIFYLLNSLYLIYFIFFHSNNQIVDIIFLNNPLNTKINIPVLNDITFTFLEVALLSMMYVIYSEGVKSNKIYNKTQNFLICISGDSGSGKTYFMNVFKNIIQSSGVYLEGDAEHKWERNDSNWENITHLNPKANYLYAQNETLKKLKLGEPIERREYDHDTGKFTSNKTINPKDFIFISGLHSFYLPKTRNMSDLTIFLDTPDHLKYQWKIDRDSKERNYKPDSVEKKIEERAEDYKNFISIQKNYADIVFSYDGTNTQSIDSLKVEIDSSLDVEDLLEKIKEIVPSTEWDYSEDLSKLLINLEEITISSDDAQRILIETVPNYDEILSQNYQFGKNIEALVSLFVLKSMSYKMSEAI